MNIIAHRGASSEAPENTMSAFRKALELGSGHIELDVRRTIDNKVVVIHDKLLNRTTNGDGEVIERTYNYVKKLDAGTWFSSEFKGEPVPLLEHVLEELSSLATLHVEIKDNSIDFSRLVVGVIRRAKAEEKVWLTSFNHDLIEYICSLYSNLNTARLFRKNSELGGKVDFDLKGKMICPHVSDVSYDMVEKFGNRDILVRPWGLKNDLGLLTEMHACNVYGVTFDDVRNGLDTLRRLKNKNLSDEI